MVVDCPLRDHGGMLMAWYLVCLVSLKILVQILKAVTLTVPTVQPGVIRDVLVTFRMVRGSFLGTGVQEGHFGMFPQFQYCGPSSGEIC